MKIQGELDSLQVTIVAEDSVLYESPLLGQHGISMFLEARRGEVTRNILVDVAQNPQALLENMKLLGIQPESIDTIVITHCHYDHTQGLVRILERIYKSDLPVVVHPELFRLNFVDEPFLRHVGVMGGDAREKIAAAGGILFECRQPLQLLPGLCTSGEIERETDFEEVGIALRTIVDGNIVEDAMPDDLSLFARIRNKGTVILTGCSHAGVVNICRQCRKMTGKQPITALIGGFHLVEASAERISRTVEALGQLEISSVLAGHCTGFNAQAELLKAFGERFTPLRTGMRFAF
ncbi:MAG: MBL fold metallo-hydrolase [Spirochaetales bacterium]|nr:MBL fold metallo-hydrolase [Spirochaetales bacterium]